MYTLNFIQGTKSTSVKSAEILEKLKLINTPESQHIQTTIQELEINGCKYSNQDFDILSRAFHYIESISKELSIWFVGKEAN